MGANCTRKQYLPKKLNSMKASKLLILIVVITAISFSSFAQSEVQMSEDEKRAKVEALRAYCRRDSWGMVALHDWLLEHAAAI